MLWEIIKITDVMHRKAISLCKDEAFNHRSITRDGSNQYCGHIAELAFANYLDLMLVSYEYCGDMVFDYDFVIGGETYDVKAKARNVPCRYEYDAHVNAYQIGFDVDYYVFASVHMVDKRASNCEFMAWMPKDRYWNDCRMTKIGDDSDGLIEKSDSGKMKYVQMLTMHALVDKLLGVPKWN